MASGNVDEYERTLLFNPGSAGPKRFSFTRGIVLLTIARKTVLPCLIKLRNKVHRRELKQSVGRAIQKGAKP